MSIHFLAPSTVFSTKSDRLNPMASWRLLWILIVRNCSVCSVLCLCLGSRLSPWRGFLPRLPLTLLPGVALLRLRRHRPLRAFHLQFSLRCAGLNSAHVLPNTRLVLNMFAVISMFFSAFFAVFSHWFAPSF